MSIAPMEETSAVELPEIPPKSMETMMFTSAVPPRMRPTIRLQKFMSFLVTPPSHMICAMTMKNGAAIMTKLCMLVTIFMKMLSRGISR